MKTYHDTRQAGTTDPGPVTVTGRLVGAVYEWTNSDVHTLLLQTADGEATPLIVHGPALFKQCKRRRNLIVEGERNTTDDWGLPAGTAIVVATIHRSAEGAPRSAV